MKPEELATQFAEATLSFDQIIGQPTDTDIVHIFEALAQILLPVPYDEARASHNLIGLVYSEAEYTAEYVDPFVTPIKPGIYDTISQKMPMKAYVPGWKPSTKPFEETMASTKQLSEEPVNSSLMWSKRLTSATSNTPGYSTPV